MEDDMWLARCLDRQADTAAAHRAYDAHQQDRTAMIVRMGRRMGRMLHLSNPIAVAARNTLFKYAPDRLFERAWTRAIATDI